MIDIWILKYLFVTFQFRMDSFFLAEMFKYLYLLFADKEDIIFDIEDYIFTTEAHLLPLWLSTTNRNISKKNTVSFKLNALLILSLLYIHFIFLSKKQPIISSVNIRTVGGKSL